MDTMNQYQIQEKTEDKVLKKAKYIAENKRITRHPNDIFCVQSGNDKTPGVFYAVIFDKQLDCFLCDCKDFEMRGATRPCCHIMAACLKFGGTA
jgi:hypothetical protein